jgi:DNA-binding FadR family transcriptional regulator
VSEPRFAIAQGDASERIALELRRYLARNDLRPGDRLGTEQELADEFGVSRPTLREALRILASGHLVRATRGPGGGIFVESTPNEGMGRSLSDSIATMLDAEGVSLRELVEARIHLEVPISGLAALHATDETAAELESAIAEARGNDPVTDAFRLADFRFHRTLATAAGNELMGAFTSWTLDVLQPSLVRTVGHTFDAESILGQHEEILRAVRRRQQRAAERAMRRHLEYLLEMLDVYETEAP